MNRRVVLTSAAIWTAFSASGAIAQQPADIEGVRAASKAFYTALDVLDDGTAMEKIWASSARTSTYVGPQSKSIIVGWDDQKKYWESFNKRFAEEAFR
jgi:hypothetical protein